MSDTVALVAGPTAEPVQPSDMVTQLGLAALNSSALQASQTAQLSAYITAARAHCEDYCQRAFLTQVWELRRDSFPGHNLRYDWNGYPQIWLPKPPFQSVIRFGYIDVSGTPQTLTQDATFGVNPANPQYGYQLDRGSETQPARLLPPFARPWPPTRMVPANVQVRFRCGYGGPITCSMTEGSADLTVSGGAPLTFDADDAPLLPDETGLPICVPGAGPGGGALNTFVASVDEDGNATLGAPAEASVSIVQGWAGVPLPPQLVQAIKFMVQWYWEQGSILDQAVPRVAAALMDPYRNLAV